MTKEIIIPKSVADFAEEFSKNYKNLSVGTYQTDDGEFKIEYKDIADKAEIPCSLYNVASVSNKGRHILWKDNLVHYSPDYVFFVIIWCYINSIILDTRTADLEALKYALEVGKNKKKLLLGILKLFKYVPSKENKARYENIEKLFSIV